MKPWTAPGGLPPHDGRWHFRGSNSDGKMIWIMFTPEGKLYLYWLPVALYRAMTVGRLA